MDEANAREGKSVIVQLQGGLGNQMFQYAFGKSVSEATGQKVTFVKEPGSRRPYGLDAFDTDVVFSPRLETPVFYENPFCYNPGVYQAAINGASFSGHWQTERYFNSELVRKHMNLRGTPSIEALWTAERILAARGRSAFIHVRRTDYVGVNESYHGLMSLNYYRQAVHRIRLQVDNPKFFIFSDDPEWCKITFPNLIDCEVVEGNKAHEDLWLMALCQHAIIANSSFSWWGAWLNPLEDIRPYCRVVIGPEKWFATPTLESKDILPDRWLRYGN
jgi:hypothetical protein